jgi:hypothetical protein
MLADDFRTRQALADLKRVAGGDRLPDDICIAFDHSALPDRLWAAAARLLWQALASGSEEPFLEDLWDQRHAALIAAPAPIRAALMNGFNRLCDLMLLLDSCRPGPNDLVTLSRTSLEPALMTLARAMTLREIDHISRGDYAYNVDRYREALATLLEDPRMVYPPGQYRYPAEVVELVAHVPGSPGYIPCMAIVLLDALRYGDHISNAEFRLERQWAKLEGLPQRPRDAFLATFRHLYESKPHWSPKVPGLYTLPWVENIGSPAAKSVRRKR